MTGTMATESEKIDLLYDHVEMRIDDITSNNVNSIVADIYVRDAKSMLEVIRSLQQQVNTLTEVITDARKEFDLWNNQENAISIVKGILDHGLQSIKESPREEQT